MKNSLKEILIIEDDLGIIELYTTKLREHDYSVSSVYTAKDGISYLKAQNPYLILLDYGLPDMNGMEFIEEVNRLKIRIVPFIVSTGQGNEEIAVDMMKHGAYDYIVKDSHLLDKLPKIVRRVDRAIENEKKLKQAELRIQESELKYNAIFNDPSIFLGTLKTNGTIIESNESVLNFAGVTNQEVSEKKLWEAPWWSHSMEMQNKLKKSVSRTAKGKYDSFESTNIGKNAEIISIHFSIRPVRDKTGVINSLIYNAIDISERKNIEKEAQAHAERFRVFFSSVNDAIFVFPIEENCCAPFLEINDIACERYGYPKEEFMLLSINEITKNVNNELLATPFHQVELLETGHLISEAIHIGKSGEEFPVEINSSIVYQYGQRVILSVVRDITERKQSEQQLQIKNQEYMILNKELQESLERIQNINTELEKAKVRAEESDKLKMSFLTNISHEIRTPMNGILGFAELLKSPELTGAEQNKYIKIIEKSSYRMLNIINDLIDISKIEAGQTEIHVQETPVNTIIDDLFTFFKPEAKAKGVNLIHKKDLTFKNSIIMADKNRVMQVLSNLINNAIKFTSSGSILFGYRKKEFDLEFYVQDTGIGIPSEMKDIVFERFRQVDISIMRCYEGSGLGLSISKAFVEMHGGKIWVESKQGEGSTFYFTLPYEIQAKEILNFNKKKKDLKLSLSSEMTILIVDDDEISSLFLNEIIKEKKLTTIHANNGEEAINIVNNNPDIDIILMDIKMPKIDGLEATKIIKAKHPFIPIIAQTAFAQTNNKKEALEAGCNDYISKPIIKEILLELIRKYADAKQKKFI